ARCPTVRNHLSGRFLHARCRFIADVLSADCPPPVRLLENEAESSTARRRARESRMSAIRFARACGAEPVGADRLLTPVWQLSRRRRLDPTLFRWGGERLVRDAQEPMEIMTSAEKTGGSHRRRVRRLDADIAPKDHGRPSPLASCPAVWPVSASRPLLW